MAHNDLTTSQAAHRLDVGKSTVNLWCRRGLFPNARSEETPRGLVWLIPEADLASFRPPVMGRPKKMGSEKSSGPDGKVGVKRAKKKGSKK